MKLFLGLAKTAIVCLIVGLVVYLASHNTGYAFTAICGALTWKLIYRPPAPVVTPSCFGGYAHYNPNITAERDCRNCPFIQDCIEETPFRHTGEST